LVLLPISCSFQFKIILCLLLLNGIACANQAEPILVDIDWLLKHQSDPDLVIVDARSKKEYKQGHIVNAVNIPVADTFNPIKNTDRVGNINHITQLFRNAGIRNEHTVVIYDGNSYIDAGRVFWVFEVYGHKKVKLLDGGVLGWKIYSKQPLSQLVNNPEKSNYIPAINPQRHITRLSMRLALDDENKVIIDTRPKDDFAGKKSIARRSGHIPNAVNIPWDENFVVINGIKMLKPIDELRTIYDKVIGEKKAYLYCNKGKQSSLSYTILRQLGYDAAHYDGSWYEWGNDNSLPIEGK
jgi:thiosulfate/3-mercaptopyruvate sulfurtransferase